MGQSSPACNIGPGLVVATFEVEPLSMRSGVCGVRGADLGAEGAFGVGGDARGLGASTTGPDGSLLMELVTGVTEVRIRGPYAIVDGLSRGESGSLG